MNSGTYGPWRSAGTLANTSAIVSEKTSELICTCKKCDAPIIAAAPEMLAALEELVDAAEYRGFHPEFLINARAAIAKARGQA
jgi:hypothetical protein